MWNKIIPRIRNYRLLSYTLVNKPRVSIVTGSNRGLGLEIVKQTLQRTNDVVIAACRVPEKHPLTETDRLQILQLDLENQESIEDFSQIILSKYSHIDKLFNVAGILHETPYPKAPERKLLDIQRQWLTKSIQINTIGPIMLTKSLVPLLGKTKKDTKSSIVVNFSARVGSITDNRLGGWYSYRISKAALNMATKTLSHEFKRKGIWVISFHPGTTNTELSKPFQHNVKAEKLFTTNFSISKLYEIIDSMDESKSGEFFAWDGTHIEW